ncbi:beta-lactamase [Hydrogenophaga intermedia]|uniref:beta-lactamase n=1 Tax=Hydrogenophaga intermedia TaxID=65786 RepID=UPI0020437EFA|nr:beta-lactamase [Hydrogenophaga intermedia]MCM3564772.1 beta-lactamase [Hydrogenophaga intermedia]
MTVDNIAPIKRRRLILAAASACVAPALAHSATRAADVEALLSATYGPLVRTHDIPGLVVGLVLEGRPYFLESGTTARQGGGAATRNTIFELGSISKCFASTLAALAHVEGRLNLDLPVGEIVPPLRGTPIGQATPLHLATYTAGGLPLQFPEDVTSDDQAIAYLSAFNPSAAPGVIRRYSNPSIGLLGHATAEALGGDFAELSKRALLAPLGLTSTYIQVPDAQMHRYAWGHDKNQRQVRVNPGVFDAQAYGIKSTASDMLHFLQSLLDPERMPPALRLAVAHTMIPRYQVGPMQQGMGWEMYPSPWSLQALVEGNGPRAVFDALAVQAISPRAVDARDKDTALSESLTTRAVRSLPPPTRSMLLNKTGSTFGFAGYVALIPQRQVALVMLANRNFPAIDRVAAAHQVMNALGALG